MVTTSQRGRLLALWGAWLQLGLVLGLLGTVVGMISAFEQISEHGQANAERLSADISFALVATAIGVIPALIGVVFLAVALFRMKYRAPWFFWFLVLYSGLWVLNFPVGTIIAGALIVFLIMRKDEFLKSQDAKDQRNDPPLAPLNY